MKLYTFEIYNGTICTLQAKNNKDAMKLLNSSTGVFGDIKWLKDENGNYIIKNIHI